MQLNAITLHDELDEFFSPERLAKAREDAIAYLERFSNALADTGDDSDDDDASAISEFTLTFATIEFMKKKLLDDFNISDPHMFEPATPDNYLEFLFRLYNEEEERRKKRLMVERAQQIATYSFDKSNDFSKCEDLDEDLDEDYER